MKILYIIPARKGSKGLPGKNVKILGHKPLIEYSIDFALDNIKPGDELCISTNDDDVISIASERNIEVHFRRPENLSTDTVGTYEVLLHAVNYFQQTGKAFDAVILLQPTSPLRSQEDFFNVRSMFDDSCDMAVTVTESKENPYFNLFEENANGYLEKSKGGNYQRRQDCPPVYSYNGSIYLIRTSSLRNLRLNDFEKIRKVVMPRERSVDIDTMEDWKLAEYYLSKYNENS